MRKLPQQQRSRDMVERLVTAGREVLMNQGYAGFTTNKVADQAGVSPGSLYQYFPNKAALLDVIVDRYWEEVAERITASLVNNAGHLDADAVGAVADSLLDALEEDAALLRVIAEELPVVRLKAQRAALEQRLRDVVAAFLAVLGVKPKAAYRQAWIAVMAMEAVAIRWVLDDPGIERDALRAELTGVARLIVNAGASGDSDAPAGRSRRSEG